ncbi:MAG: sulfotransferase [Proteobacteria bacterium]|nr:sulfotransferase [Pseudomonadota bacterium]
MLTGSELLRSLQNRLKLNDLWSRRPSVLDTPVERPVFVTGSARSGTSITHELLDCDPAVRAPLLWEMLHPVERSEGTGSPGRAQTADRAYRFWHQLQPEYESMHFNAGSLPNECIYIFLVSFLSDQFAGCHHIPSYSAHLSSADHRSIYREHRRVLQTLEPGSESARWVLKAPSHLSMLRSLFSVYPDARVVITHRDPVQCLSSALSLMGTLQWMRSEHVDLEPLVREMPAQQADLWQDVQSARSSGELPDSQFIDVRYCDLVADPAFAIGRNYRELEWEY